MSEVCNQARPISIFVSAFAGWSLSERRENQGFTDWVGKAGDVACYVNACGLIGVILIHIKPG